MNTFSYITRQFLLYNTLFWLLIIAVNFSTAFGDSLKSDLAFDWVKTTVLFVLAYGPWMLFTPFLYAIINKAVAMERKHKVLTVYLLLFIGWVPLYITFDSLVMLWNRGITGKSLLEGVLLYPKFYWFFDAVIYSSMFGAYLALIYYRDSQQKKFEALRLTNHNTQLELRLSELKMQALQAQLEPHFLFNALNSISSLVRIADKKQALNAIRQLSDLLRFAVGASPRKLVKLSEELQFTRDYVDLQRLRFSQRLTVNFNNACQVDDVQCPPYVVQTLIENAIVHNLEKSGDSLTIDVNTGCDDTCLTIVVTNCALQTDDKHQGLGVGLQNLRNRMTILYQQEFSLEVTDDGTVYQVDLSLPIQTDKS